MSQLQRSIKTDFGTVEVGWDGQSLTTDARLLAIDTETTMVDHGVPDLVVLSASNGERHVVVHADDVFEFLAAHWECRWMFFHVAFDFWVLHRAMEQRSPGAGKELFLKAESGTVHDAMLLDRLLRLATNGDGNVSRGLEVVAREFGGVQLSKDADKVYRQGYGALLGKPFSAIKDDHWFEYAAKDAYATFIATYDLLCKACDLVTGECRDSISDDTIRRHGILSETIQIMGGIALADLSRNGMAIDGNYRGRMNRDLETQMLSKASELETLLITDLAFNKVLRDARVFKIDAAGDFERTATTGGLSKRATSLQKVLSVVLDRIETDTGKRPFIPSTPSGSGMCLAFDVWCDYRAHHPVVDLWLSIDEIAKHRQFLSSGASEAHPKYNVLLKTGRTSCSNPNLQNVPRDSGIREMYVPHPGHVFIAADYSQIELRTLAQVCYTMFGESKLKEVFDRGEDPHTHTAASITGLTVTELLKRQDMKHLRQSAKAINFGVPGGMGPASLASYAKRTYGATLTEQEAEKWREDLINKVYPEIGQYLESADMVSLAHNLSADIEDCWKAFEFRDAQGYVIRNGAVSGYIRRVVAGKTASAAGKSYRQNGVDRVWESLRSLCKNSSIRPLLDGVGSPEKASKLFAFVARTLTGRLRAGCTFTQAHNTPFQGLAADGAKIALFELVSRGFRVVAFIHDEIIVEVPLGCDLHAKGDELVKVMVESMKQVCPDVPIECGDAVAMSRWSKDALRLLNPDGTLGVWSPEESASIYASV